MAVLDTQITQPSATNTVVRARFVGDPILHKDELVIFVGYGYYYVVDLVQDVVGFMRTYDLRFAGRYSGASVPNAIPIGTVAVVPGEGVTHAVLPYNSTIFLNFLEPDYRSLTLTGDIVFATQKHAPAKSIVVKVRNGSGTLSRNLAFPPSWIFIGPSGRPSTIAPSRTGILSITCFGTSDADVIAAWAVQA